MPLFSKSDMLDRIQKHLVANTTETESMLSSLNHDDQIFLESVNYSPATPVLVRMSDANMLIVNIRDTAKSSRRVLVFTFTVDLLCAVAEASMYFVASGSIYLDDIKNTYNLNNSWVGMTIDDALELLSNSLIASR